MDQTDFERSIFEHEKAHHAHNNAGNWVARFQKNAPIMAGANCIVAV